MKTFVILLTAVLLIGCASTGRKIDMTKIDQIKKGETSQAEVLQLLGTPQQTTRNSKGETTFTYIYTYASTKAETFIPIVGAFAGGANVQTQMTTISFGPDGKVSEYTTSSGANNVSTGLSTDTGSSTNAPAPASRK